ncbi:YdgA family protein [Chania multitudinisentens]|uniref:YdgA family protein n=1 Tax=Chania multitudinisentens TaxID=1639108 RepID=UPI0003E153AC|nr:YdgA family protein [Chania multitudinisentens]
MKKSLVAVSVIVVLGAAWAGASWHTGKLIEQRMGEMVDNANSQLKTYLPQFGLKLSYENYQRGIFSSQIRYVLRSDDAVTSDSSLLKAGEEVAFLETVSHGPLPIAQLKRFNLIPSLASIHTELENTPKVKALFDITNGKSLFTAETRIAYSGDTSSAIDVIPIDYQKDKSTLKFSGATFDADIGRDLQTMVLNGNSDSTTISGLNQLGQLEQVTLQGLTLKSDARKGQFDISLGEQTLGLKQVKVTIDGKETVSLEDVAMGSLLDEKGTKLNGAFDYTLGAMKIMGNDFGSGKLLLKIDNLDGNALKTFAENYNQQAMAMLQQSETMNPIAYQEKTAEILAQNLLLLLKGNPTISIAPLSWKNSKGESTFTLNLDLLEPTQAAAPAASLDQLLGQSVKKLDAVLTIPTAMAAETVAQAVQLQGYSAEEAQKIAQQQIQSLATTGQMFQLTTLKDDVISSTFRYSDNQIELNGKKMSPQDFAGLFSMLGLAPAAPAPAGQDNAPAQGGAIPDQPTLEQ